MAFKYGWLPDGTRISFNTDHAPQRTPTDITFASLPSSVSTAVTGDLGPTTANNWRIWTINLTGNAQINAYSTATETGENT